MVTQPKFIVCTPDDLYFCSEVEIQLNNFRQFEYTHDMFVLVFQDGKEQQEIYKSYWDKLQQLYSEVTFLFYSNPNLKQLQKVYPQICRIWMLSELYTQFPELSNEYIFYLDSDVLITKHINWSEFISDGTCYMSRTNYIGAQYFDNKKSDVMFHKREEYNKRDILQSLCNIVGIDKQTVIDNELNTGGCQYLLTGIDANFWKKVINDCIQIRLQALNINQQYFVSEEKGLQSWCADMWAVLWNLWKLGIKTSCPELLNFSWASSPIEEYNKNAIFHNAGVNSKFIEVDNRKHRMYYKGDIRFRTSSITPFDIDDFGEISREFCGYHYINAIKSVDNPICITDKIIY